MRVLLVEDNEVYRSTLELLLDGRDGLEIVGSVDDGRDAADAAERVAQRSCASRQRRPMRIAPRCSRRVRRD